MSNEVRQEFIEQKSYATEGNGGFPVSGLSRSPARPIPPKLYRIGEVVEYSGMSRQTIHNYTTMGLLHESRWTEGGHRLYDESVFSRLDQIAQLRSARKSIDAIRDHFLKFDSNMLQPQK